ncbi:hypothetical protein [Paraburkholderia sp. RL17-337-BIB-A]|uniref:hypothetical protein n=1 Tax=Paraburkholderia sp. RL17-337-BIB-A TaxID=3031636 RepID=UPI0038BC0B15
MINMLYDNLDFQGFYPDKDWIKLKENHSNSVFIHAHARTGQPERRSDIPVRLSEVERAASVESRVGGTRTKSGAMHAAPFSRP